MHHFLHRFHTDNMWEESLGKEELQQIQHKQAHSTHIQIEKR